MKTQAVFFGLLALSTTDVLAHPSVLVENNKLNATQLSQILSLASPLLPSGVQASSPHKPTPTILSCGQVITADTVMAADLNCPNTTGFVIQIVGNGITFDGNGHSISGPLAAAAIYVNGSSNTVTHVQGSALTYGAFAYDSPGVSFQANEFSSNQIGMEIYAQNTQMTGVQIIGNIARSNAIFALDMGSGSPGQIILPYISGNDFSNSGLYAMSINAASFEYPGATLDNLTGSANGIELSGGVVTLQGFSMSNNSIAGTQIFAVKNKLVNIANVDVSTLAPNTGSGQRIGIDLYEVGQFSIENTTASNNDNGLRIETQSGVSTVGTAIGCTFKNNSSGGISVVSYDNTQFGLLSFVDNTYQESQTSLDIVLSPGLTLAPEPSNGTSYLGCFTDASNRALNIELASSGSTIENCTALAKAHNLMFAGLQCGGQCFGGNTLGYASVLDSQCNLPCSANKRETCGGSWLNSVYSTGATPKSTASPSPASEFVGNYEYIGCFTDSPVRALPIALAGSASSVEECVELAKAKGLSYAGLQYGGQCFGGNSLGYAHVEPSQCTMTCSNDAYESCGGSWLNSVYATGLGSPSNYDSQSYQYVGCYSDSSKRALPILLSGARSTVEECTKLANDKGLKYAGLQYGGQCFGGNTLGNVAEPDSQCNMPCSAKSEETCGGDWRNSVYLSASSI